MRILGNDWEQGDISKPKESNDAGMKPRPSTTFVRSLATAHLFLEYQACLLHPARVAVSVPEI